MKAYIYNTSTGQILRTVSCPDDQISYQCGTGESYVESDIGDDVAYYILDGVVTEKPENPSAIDITIILADATDHPHITGIPNPSTVTLTGPGIYPETGIYWTIETGVFEFAVDTVGEYVLTISSGFPYLDKTFTITAE